MSGMSAGFHAETIRRRESGLRRISSMTPAIWSIVSPDGVGQDRHCTP